MNKNATSPLHPSCEYVVSWNGIRHLGQSVVFSSAVDGYNPISRASLNSCTFRAIDTLAPNPFYRVVSP